ncbi:MAG: EAL domain-containing protein [Gammaproteobacteria bacterium]|nr:EAL domain-containing protein [Gammaproteobacteria bacterium]
MNDRADSTPEFRLLESQDAAFYLGLMRAYLDSANDGIFVLCDEQKFLIANRTMADWLGEPEEKLTAHNQRVPITEFLGPVSSQEIFAAHFHDAIAGKVARFECPIHPPNGQPRWVEISMNRVDVGSGDMVIAVVRDVTQQKLIQLRLEQQALRDDLTGLINRRGFMIHLERLARTGTRDGRTHALLCLDLDQFKLVNDTCGHSAGDELLQQVAILLQSSVRGHDKVCRLGGDEFAVLLSDCSGKEAMDIVLLIQQAFSSFRFVWQDRTINLAASIGMAEIDDTAKDSLAILMRADAACYAAKERGRNQVAQYVDDGTITRLRSDMDWVSAITASLDRDRFCVYFQKIVPAAESARNIAHREMLLRMIDANGQIVAPGKFMAAAIKYNMMTAIDRWVIRNVFAAMRLQRRERVRPDAVTEITTINLSGASLNDDSFYSFLKDQISAHDVQPCTVCFEITESVAVDDLERVARFMAEFRTLGFRFALDDFGSGMSSFSYLKALPVDFIKIDGGLVREVSQSPLDRRIIESIVYIAREMGVQTIAEYVENPETCDCLAAIGVDYVQGYAIHRPEPLGSTG